VRDAHHGDEEAQVGGERLLAREQEEGAVLDGVRELVDDVVGFDDVLGCVEIAVEERLRAACDRFGREGAEADDVRASPAASPSLDGVVVTTPPMGPVRTILSRAAAAQPGGTLRRDMSSVPVYLPATFGQRQRNPALVV
jgi:hypothetical protein